MFNELVIAYCMLGGMAFGAFVGALLDYSDKPLSTRLMKGGCVGSLLGLIVAVVSIAITNYR